jgi:hypothetical protein
MKLKILGEHVGFDNRAEIRQQPAPLTVELDQTSAQVAVGLKPMKVLLNGCHICGLYVAR